MPPFIPSFLSTLSTRHHHDRYARESTSTTAPRTVDLTEETTPDRLQEEANDKVTKTGADRSEAAAAAEASADNLALLRRQLVDAERALSTATARARTVDHNRALKASTSLQQNESPDLIFRPRSPRNHVGHRSPLSINNKGETTSPPPLHPPPSAATLSRDHGSTVIDIPSSRSHIALKTRTPFLRGVKVPRSRSEVARGVSSGSWFTADDDFYADTSLDRMALFRLQGIPHRHAWDIQQRAAALIDVLPPNLTPESSSLGVVMRYILLHTVQDTDIIIIDAAKLVAAEMSDLVGALRNAWLNRGNTNLPSWPTIQGHRESPAGAAAATGVSSPRVTDTDRRSAGNVERSTSTGRHGSNTERTFFSRDRDGNGPDRQRKRRAKCTDGSSTDDTRTVRFSLDNLGNREEDNHSERSSFSEARSAASPHKEHVRVSSRQKGKDRNADKNTPRHRPPVVSSGMPSKLISRESKQARALCKNRTRSRRIRENDHHSHRSSSSEARSAASLHKEHVRAPSRQEDKDRKADNSTPRHRSPVSGTPSKRISRESEQARPPSSTTRASRHHETRGRQIGNGSDERGDRVSSQNPFRLFYHPIHYSFIGSVPP